MASPKAQLNSSARAFEYRESEVVFGAVAPVGTDLSHLKDLLKAHLQLFQYKLNYIKLSEFLALPEVVEQHKVVVAESPEFKRISSLMDAGNKTRKAFATDDIMALLAASAIGRQRVGNQAIPATVHLLDSLKRPEEVYALRRIYGQGFFLIGVYSPESDRLRHLEHRGMTKELAAKLIERDRDEETRSGQRTRATFQLSDVFVRMDGSDLDLFKEQMRRFVDLVFGCPFQTPTAEEHAMFLAYASSLRSADLSRQVGAVVVSEAGEVVATGANDVPSFGGGLQWPGPSDKRDHVIGVDSNKVAIQEIVQEIVDILGNRRSPLPSLDLERRLAGTKLHDLTEFGRAVHAEMEAIASCARVGVSPRNGSLFTTTFPCHNCAKHIVAAGIKEVLYVEPYPKSRALDLHGDSIAFEHAEPDKVLFRPFVGVTARRYFDLFSMQLSAGHNLSRKHGGRKREFVRLEAKPRIPMAPVSYIEREMVATSSILTRIGWGEHSAKEDHQPSGRRKTTKRQ